jgi:hypothetical protein
MALQVTPREVEFPLGQHQQLVVPVCIKVTSEACRLSAATKAPPPHNCNCRTR